MKKFFSQIKEKIFSGDRDDSQEEAAEEGYVELDTDKYEGQSKIIVRPFVLQDFEGLKDILDVLREGKTIALLNIKPLKDKDLIELKRVINKLKKTTDAIEGEIAGFGEDYIVVTPSFAQIYRSKDESGVQREISKEDRGGEV